MEEARAVGWTRVVLLLGLCMVAVPRTRDVSCCKRTELAQDFGVGAACLVDVDGPLCPAWGPSVQQMLGRPDWKWETEVLMVLALRWISRETEVSPPRVGLIGREGERKRKSRGQRETWRGGGRGAQGRVELVPWCLLVPLP